MTAVKRLPVVWDGPPAQVRVLTTCPRLDNEVTSWAGWEQRSAAGRSTHSGRSARAGGQLLASCKDLGKLIGMPVRLTPRPGD